MKPRSSLFLPLFSGALLSMTVAGMARQLELGDFAGFSSASSQMEPKLKLGPTVDEEEVQEEGGLLSAILRLLTNSTATSDDANGSDDEDGVSFPPIIAGGGTYTVAVTVTNTTSNPGYLNAWIDFNNDGVLNDVVVTTAGGEKLTAQIAVPAGTAAQVHNLTFTVPANASLGTGRGLRVRLTNISNPSPTGEVGKGEVEDYILDIASPGYCYGVSNGELHEINIATGNGRYITDLAFSGSGNSLAFTKDLGADGVLIYSTGENDDMRLGVWDRATGASNIAGNIGSFGGPSRGVLRCGAWYGGRYWFIPDSTDDLWRVSFTGTSGNYRISAVQKVCDLWSNSRAHTFGDFIVKPDGTMMAIGTKTGGSPEFFTANLAATTPAATLRGSPPVMQNGIALGLDGKIYGGLGLNDSNRDWYIISSTNGTVVSKVGASNLTQVSDMTLAVPWPAPVMDPLLDYGDHSRLPLAGSLKVNTIRLGGIVDGEAAAITNATATGDDTSGSDDEDGVIMPDLLLAGIPATIPVTVLNNSAGPAYLSAWIDFNNDGVLNDALTTTAGGERLMSALTIAPGAQPVALSLTFTVPDHAVAGAGRGARFRISNAAATGPAGSGGSGEVEDYLVNIESVRAAAVMEVRPAGTKDWGTNIAIQAGREVDFRLTLTNSGTLPFRDPVVVNLLPAPGDTGAVDLTPRGSTWKPLLTRQATTSPGVRTWYSTVPNPQRPEVLNPHPPGSVPPAWFALPANPGTVSSLRFDGTGLTLSPGAVITMEWNMTIPWDAPAPGAAWSSVGVSVARNDDGTRLPGRESNRAGVQALEFSGEQYGDRVWHDANKDGLQSPGEAGINGVRVEFYRDNGDGRPDPYTDFLTASTYTTTIGGQAGSYRFGHFAPGNYFAALAPSDNWGLAAPDTGADDAVDSDPLEVIRAGRRTGLMPVTKIDAGERDLTWDAGLIDLSGTPAVWAIAQSGDGMILGGRFAKSHGVARNNIVKVTSSGAVDTGFDPGSGFDGTVRSIAVRKDGLIWVAGQFTAYNGYPAAGVALLSPNGAWDPRPAQPDTCVVHWAGASDNQMYLAGSFSRVGGIPCGNVARLQADGSVDTAFSKGAGANGPVYDGAVLPDGGILLAGGFTSYHSIPRKGIVKLRAGGGLDESFDPGSGAAGEVYSIHCIEDGRIHLTGNFRTFNGVACNGAVRLDKDGKVDPTLKPSSLAVDSINSSN